MTQVYVIGAAMTPLAKHLTLSAEELMAQSLRAAQADAGGREPPTGVNFYLAGIENAAITRSAVVDCAVLGRLDPGFGRALFLLAALQLHDTLDVGGLRARLDTQLTRSKLPELLKTRRAVPRDKSGKIRERVLRQCSSANRTNRP